MNKKTVVIGASDNPEKYSYKATIALQKNNHEVIPVGIREGIINGITIITGKPIVTDVDTVTLYVGAKNQPDWFDYVIGLKPKRVVFNPGTENPEFEQLLQKNNIATTEACTLVLLAIGDY
jgi:predicted CoA-binding protein